MKPGVGQKQLKENCNNVEKTIHRTDARIVDDEGQVITEAYSRLSISLKPEDDVPHPRHLCFTYPFGKSSPKSHCTKCYCYVCEEIAPCKMWNKNPQRHCHATDRDDKWKLERKNRKKLLQSTTMDYHKFTIGAHVSSDLSAHVGGLICNNNGEWLIGISVNMYNNDVKNQDPSIPLYAAFAKVLGIAWSIGFRNLQIKLGYFFHDQFWLDFTKDDVTRKFDFRFDQTLGDTPAILKVVENCLNQEWFIDVKNTEAFEEEADAVGVSCLADCEEQDMKVYDFRTHPKTKGIKEIARDLPNMYLSRIKPYESSQILSAAQKKYFGVN
uniref:Uncharacterized protein n=1 Tax=Chenopodium quinoa TaxID=63459 RepID=A0A803LJC2_CHEQI